MHKILANTVFLGKDLQILTDCHSTNETALSLVRSGKATEGTVVLALNQSRGKGQRGRQWHAAAGMNLTFSFILMPTFIPVNQQFVLNMAIALGVYQGLSRFVSGIAIKWPNDFLYEGRRKLGGMLLENRVRGRQLELQVAGIGINVNQLKFPVPQAISLAAISGSSFSLDEVLTAILLSVEDYYLRLKAGEGNAIRAEYLRHLYQFERWASYHDGDQFTGMITGVGEDGRLLVRKQNGEEACYDLKQITFL
jgi:BirA family biotin operon repressor/biotin-[acetyl-CoA-carboxylase] ligase